MRGSEAKFPWGGGGEVDHSSVLPPQGLAAARGPRTQEIPKFSRGMRKPTPKRKALTEMKALSGWRSGRYSATRRFMPSTPATNMGQKVRLKKTSIHQALIFPHSSLCIRPENFGHQKYIPASQAKIIPPTMV